MCQPAKGAACPCAEGRGRGHWWRGRSGPTVAGQVLEPAGMEMPIVLFKMVHLLKQCLLSHV